MNASSDNIASSPAFTLLLWRYLSFVWLFDEIPPRANRMLRAAIVRANRTRGLRYLPVYMRRYCHMILVFGGGGYTTDAMAVSDVVAGTFFTLGTVTGIALLVATIGFTAMRLRAFDHANY